MITFDEYQRLLSESKTRTMTNREQANIVYFLAANPTSCPKCGCQVFDPFGFGYVIHDVTHKTQSVAAMPNEKS